MGQLATGGGVAAPSLQQIPPQEGTRFAWQPAILHFRRGARYGRGVPDNRSMAAGDPCCTCPRRPRRAALIGISDFR